MKLGHLLKELKNLNPELDVFVRDFGQGGLVELNDVVIYDGSHVQLEFSKRGPMRGGDYRGYQVSTFNRSGEHIETHGFIPGKDKEPHHA